MKKNVAFFDFDGTITYRDSFLLFMQKASMTRYLFACSLLFPKIFLYLFKSYSSQQLKENFLYIVFKGKDVEELKQQAVFFCANSLKNIIRPDALSTIRLHQKNGDRVVIVTASPRIFLEPWCKGIGVDILGTELAVDAEGKVTGRLEGKNCKGEEKVKRIKARYSLTEYETIYAYGDTEGDIAMLNLAAPDKRYFKPFRKG